MKPGDIVCYTRLFLQSVDWLTDVPDWGEVKAVNGHLVRVLWCDDPIARTVLDSNLLRHDRRHLEAR